MRGAPACLCLQAPGLCRKGVSGQREAPPPAPCLTTPLPKMGVSTPPSTVWLTALFRMSQSKFHERKARGRGIMIQCTEDVYLSQGARGKRCKDPGFPICMAHKKSLGLYIWLLLMRTWWGKEEKAKEAEKIHSRFCPVCVKTAGMLLPDIIWEVQGVVWGYGRTSLPSVTHSDLSCFVCVVMSCLLPETNAQSILQGKQVCFIKTKNAKRISHRQGHERTKPEMQSLKRFRKAWVEYAQKNSWECKNVYVFIEGSAKA